MTADERALVQKIANIAWKGHGSSQESRDIYAICRDQLKIMAGG